MREYILIIEDDEPFRNTLSDLLKREGYSTVGAGDGHQAIGEAKKRLFELIVADVRLPKGMDGIEAVAQIKKIRPQAKTMVIIITGYADENAPVRAIKLGIDDYIYKPFKMEEFLHSVERNIRLYRLEREREIYLEALEKTNAQLKAAQKQLHDYSANLEEKVEERTKELKQAQSQLIQAAKMSTVGWLGAGVAHELNNPIAGILGYAQFVLQKVTRPGFTAKDFKTCKQYLEYIEKESKRCKAIVENLLSFSRRPTRTDEPLDIKQTIENALSVIRHQLELQTIKVTTNYQPDLPLVSGNVNKLQQAFINIIINAQHAMPKGGELSIQVGARMSAKKEKNIEISFKDTGCGISKENLNKIFEPFFTTKQDWKSVGIGLSITSHIVQEHKGTITAESKEGVGTTFVITLPASSS